MGNHIKILLAEDNEDHSDLITFSLQRAKICDRIDTVTDGEQALQFLQREGTYKDAQLPDMVLLDLNMPKVSGLEVLASIKNNEQLMHIPVVILSTSDADQDRRAAYKNHANSYLVKRFDKLQEMITDVGKYWSIWNQPPPNSDS